MRDYFFLDNAIHPSEIQSESPLLTQQKYFPGRRGFAHKMNEIIRKDNELRRELNKTKRLVKNMYHRLSVQKSTGLPNRFSMEQTMKDVIANSADDNIAIAIIKLGTSFDQAERTMSPAVVDWLLCQNSERINRSLSCNELVFHSKQNEFVLLLNKYSSAADLMHRIRALHKSLAEPHIIPGHHFEFRLNMGIANLPDSGLDKAELLDSANIALEMSISTATPWLFFKKDMKNKINLKNRLLNDMVRSLEINANEADATPFFLCYQPQVYVRTSASGDLVIDHIDAEALIRWEHPTFGLIHPDSFIPLAEDSGFIIHIGNWVLFKAIEQLEAWKETPYEHIVLSINVSSKQFTNDAFYQILKNLINTKPYIKARLKLEITESCMLEKIDTDIPKMKNLNKSGLQFALDDFGKGFSSLSYLTELPINCIKLDRSFINDIQNDKKKQIIVNSVCHIASNLGMTLICEGIESVDHLQTLERIGCMCFQGFFFSKPLQIAEFEKWVKEIRDNPVVGNGNYAQ